MNKQRKEIIASKVQMAFYKKCYAAFGYEVENEYRNKHHRYHTLVLSRTGNEMDEKKAESLRCMEQKLRIVEIIDQKKCNFLTLFFNLFVHVGIFCIQALIFSWLGLYTAHPAVMLRVGIVLMQIVLVFGLGIKLCEVIRWNGVQDTLKKEISAMETKDFSVTEMEEPCCISVLFTSGSGTVSRLIYWLTGRQYTHASIGLGKQTECFYSFNFRGFRTEHPSHRKIKNRKKNSLCYQFKVTKEEYQQLEKNIETYQRETQELHYNILGAILCVLRIYLPIKKKTDYFCSEFVSEQLREMNSFQLKKSARMYHPNNLAKTLSQQKNLYRVLVNEV